MAGTTHVNRVVDVIAATTRTGQLVMPLRSSTGAALNLGFAPVSQRFFGPGSHAYRSPMSRARSSS
jgi:hypothetical protein